MKKLSCRRATTALAVCVAVSLPSALRADDLSKNVPSEAALHAKMALKLAGLVTFVASSCPEIKTDYPRFKAAIGALGVTYEDLSKTDMKTMYLAYAVRYKEALKENCARALVNFGPGGKTVPGIFTSKAP